MTTDEKLKIDNLVSARCSVSQISQQLGLSKNTVKSYLQRKKLSDVCLDCGAALKHIPHHKKKKFCSDKCRMHYWNTHTQEMSLKNAVTIQCECCGKEVFSYRKKPRRFCSRSCAAKGRKINA